MARRRLSTWALVTGALLGVAVTLTAMAIWFWPDRDPTPVLTPEALTAATRRWAANGVANYDLELELWGQREGTIRTKVRNGVIVEHTNSGRTPPQRSWHAWSVEGMLETIERELDILAEDAAASRSATSPSALRAEFDPQYGYPRKFRRLALGASERASNRDIGWQVTRFEPVDRHGKATE